jgi:tRNA pseudouridine38-40 synthase
MAKLMQKKKPLLKRYAVTLEYDGSTFGGWQYQKNAPTVQAALEAAIRECFGETRRAGGASRTDAGVHALGQVAIFDLAYAIPPERLQAALNSALPRSVRALHVKKVPNDWDPRRASTGKTYSYLIFNRQPGSPFWAGRAWTIFRRLDVAAMRRAARFLVGRHDFSAFRAAGCEAAHPRRHVKRLSVIRQSDLVRIRVTADAFLYHMVRNFAGTLVEVGRGRMTAGQVKKILQSRDRRQAGPTAPAEGLYLERVNFGKRKKSMVTDPTEGNSLDG